MKRSHYKSSTHLTPSIVITKNILFLIFTTKEVVKSGFVLNIIKNLSAGTHFKILLKDP